MNLSRKREGIESGRAARRNFLTGSSSSFLLLSDSGTGKSGTVIILVYVGKINAGLIGSAIADISLVVVDVRSDEIQPHLPGCDIIIINHFLEIAAGV